jgi:DNA modification methylase
VNTLYYGDNLSILREHIADASVDLIYLDPPFNSKATYNLLFRSPKGQQSNAQIEAFEDTWHWGDEAEKEFQELIHQPNTDVSEMMQALRRFLGENDMMAYLTMIANRLIELHRILKNTGTLYLHCDPTASHYLKIVLDGVFGKENFRNEIVWQRTNAHNMRTKGYVRANDTIFIYAKTDEFTFNEQYTEYGPEQMSRYKPDENGRLYKAENLTFSNPNPHRQFTWRGTTPPPNRSWGASLEQLEQFYADGRILLRKDGSPRMDGLKVYLDEMKGKPLTTNWTDIDRISNTSGERLGYPTQKPLALLERIVAVSSNENDIVLDPFCGCGTTIHAAEKLKRKWIGIDITHLAISLIEKRLRDAFPSIVFEVHGTPKDLESARDLSQRDKYQFQWWACSLVNAQPYQGKKKGADSGIDGLIFFQDDKSGAKKIVVSVKGGENVGVPMIRDLGHVIDREKASIGLFVTLADPTSPMTKEAVTAGYYESPTGASFPKIQILTIKGLLDGSERPRYPDLMQGGLMFKKAKKEVAETQLTLGDGNEKH